MDVRAALRRGDVAELRQILAADPAQANTLVAYGDHCQRLTHHPLHYVSDLVFCGILRKGTELPLIEALLAAGADVNFGSGDRRETNLIGAASLGCQEVALRLLAAGADPHARGNGGETALHWAALFGELPLVERLLEGANLELEDDQNHATPLGWAIHGICEPQSNNPADHGQQREVVALLVDQGANVKPEWLNRDPIRADHPLQRILRRDAR